MQDLFEYGDMLNAPIECFYFDSEKAEFPVRPHWHYFMEIIFMLKGTAKMQAGDETYILKPGNMILVPPKSVHAIYYGDDSPLYYAVLKLDINRMNMTSNYSPKLRSIFRYAEKCRTDIFFSEEKAAAMNAQAIFKRCIDEMYTQKYGYDLIIQTEIYKLLIGILRCWQESGFVINGDAYADDSHYDIYCITEYIDKNMGSNLKVADIAELCGMSYSYFAKKFLEVYGKTCKEYIEEMRIHKAEEFLVFTDFDLTYISQETGFSDCSHMIKSFKKYRGITPKKYRTMHSESGKNGNDKLKVNAAE